MTGDDLRDFVNLKLSPYLQKFKARATGPNTIEYKIGEIFGEIKNKIQSGIEAPNIIHTNTLTENLTDIQEKDRYDVVLANPPFGGKERKEVQQNFPNQLGQQQTGLDGFAQADAIGEQEANAGHADGPEHRNQLIRFEAKATRLDGAQRLHAKRLFEEKRTMVGDSDEAPA